MNLAALIMNTIKLTIVLATFALIGCSSKPTITDKGETARPNYYVYRQEDTIGNMVFQQLLCIDSVRAEYHAENPVMEIERRFSETAEFYENEAEKNGIKYERFTEEAYQQYCLKWFELLDLCANKQFEEAVQLYREHWQDLTIALCTSTNKFNLDYYVAGPLLAEYLPARECAEVMVDNLEFDRIQTESVISFSERQPGFIPTHYPKLLETLSKLYLFQYDKDKAEELIEPYCQAIHSISDDSFQSEFDILQFKTNIYLAFEEWDNARHAYENFRDFLVRNTEESGQDYSVQIEAMDVMIREMEEAYDEELVLFE